MNVREKIYFAFSNEGLIPGYDISTVHALNFYSNKLKQKLKDD